MKVKQSPSKIASQILTTYFTVFEPAVDYETHQNSEIVCY